jgi:transmembrane sensor
VKPNGPRTWRVECGPTTIEVVGTSFQIERNDAAVRVSVTRGTVLVRGPGVSDGVQKLHAGQALSVTLPPKPANAVRAFASAPLADDDSLNEAETGPTEAAWREAAKNAKWSTAWEKLSVSGLRHESETAVRVRDLLLLADVARLSEHPREATVPLERIVAQYPNDPRAALASFTLGTMRLDLLSEPARAARDIAHAMELGLPHALAEDALARLTEAYARAGDSRRARDTAGQYRKRFPQGRRTNEIDRWSPPD